jgi:hypothetical protein
MVRSWLRARTETARRKVRRPQRRLWLEGLEDRTLLSVFFVAVNGGNDANAGTVQAPFQSIQRAVNVAHNGDTIEVAAGTYTYNFFQDVNAPVIGIQAVVSLFNKQLAILGGFSTADGFQSSNPGVNTTVIDGQGLVRGIVVTAFQAPTGLRMDGFTVTRGNGGPIPARGGSFTVDARGGGLLGEMGDFNLSNMVFSGDFAHGADSSNTRGGNASGGAIGLFNLTSTAILNNITFTNNAVQGGNGAQVGGLGQGGALFVDTSIVNGSNLTFDNNLAQGGNSAGSGVDSGLAAEGIGGAINFERGTAVGTSTLTNVLMTNNRAVGGDAPNGTPGDAFGGAMEVELSALNFNQAYLFNNTAVGGNGPIASNGLGGLAAGGGIDITNATVSANSILVIANTALATLEGPRGGGIQIDVVPGLSGGLTITNSVIAANVATFSPSGNVNFGGGGGGLALSGVTVTISQSTIDGNNFGSTSSNLLGEGILIDQPLGVPGNLILTNSIVSDHLNSFGAAAIQIQPGCNATVTICLFANNSVNFGGDISPPVAADLPAGSRTLSSSGIITASSPGFTSPGAPNFDYTLAPGSPAINQGDTKGLVDVTGRPRNNSLGAYELGSPNLTAGNFGNGTGGSSAPPAANLVGGATVGTFDPFSATFFLRNTNNSGSPDITIQFGVPGWRGIVGDWIGQGIATIGAFDPFTATFYLRDSNTPGAPDMVIQFGAPGWLPVVGDWDGNGTTTIGVVDPTSGTWYIRNANSPGAPDAVFQYGLANWLPVAGHWGGGTQDGIGIVDPSTGTWYLRSTATPGPADVGVFQYGAPGWLPAAADFGNTGKTGIATINPLTGIWYIRAAASPGLPDGTFPYGGLLWLPVPGRFIPAQKTDLPRGSSAEATNGDNLNALDSLFSQGL